MKKILSLFIFFLLLFGKTAKADTRIFYPVKDAYVDSHLTTYFYGQENILKLGRTALPPVRYFDGTRYIVQLKSSYKIAFIQFSFLGLPSSSIINSAKLRLFQTGMDGYNSVNLKFSNNNNSWTETGINYENSPQAVSPTLNSSTGKDVNGSYSEWDITNIARGWFNGAYPNNGLQIEGTPPNEDNDWWITFSSKEDIIHKPSLIVNYTIPPPTNTPTPTSFPTLSIRLRIPTIITNTPSPTLEPDEPTHTPTPTPNTIINKISITPANELTIYPTPIESNPSEKGYIFENISISPTIYPGKNNNLFNQLKTKNLNSKKLPIALLMSFSIIILLFLGLYFINKKDKEKTCQTKI